MTFKLGEGGGGRQDKKKPEAFIAACAAATGASRGVNYPCVITEEVEQFVLCM